jgi:hypothetical protein
MLIELITRIFVRAVSESFEFSERDVSAYVKICMHLAAVERLDIARHLDAAESGRCESTRFTFQAARHEAR